MKKMVFLSMLVLLAMSLIGCSGGANQVTGGTGSSQPAVGEAIETTATETTSKDMMIDRGPEINISLGETGENMKLPDNFPSEVFPLPEDANIINVNENTAAKGVGIIFMTGKSFDEAVAYCQDLMQDGTVTVEDKKDTSYLLMGSKDLYNIMITVSKYNGENISVLFDVTPQ